MGRRGEGEPPAAHTLTPTLLPTTCVVVNKPVGLTLSDNRASPARQKVFTADREIAAGGSPSPHRFTDSGRCGFDTRGWCARLSGSEARNMALDGTEDKDAMATGVVLES